MSRTELVDKIKSNRWLLLAIVFFITWKFFLIHVLWQDRVIPPEPDDSYNYITQIASIALCAEEGCPTTISLQNSSGYSHLSYRLFFGLMARLFNFSPEEAYHFSFYLGTVFLVIVLPSLLRVFSNNKYVISWSIFFLSFYHGLGESHGFFWVVPSFFLVLLFILLFINIFQEKREFHPWFIACVSIIYTFSHPMSVFLVFILPLYLYLLSFFTRQTSWRVWKRILFIISIIILSSYVSQHPILNKLPEENSYNLQKIIGQNQLNIKMLSKNGTLPETQRPTTMNQFYPLGFFNQYQNLLNERAKLLSQTYFHWLFPSWIFILPFLLSFIILLYKREIKIISLYLATFFFFIATTMLDPLGYRTALLLWPITYIFFAMSSWYGLVIIREKTRGWVKYVLLSLFVLLLILFFLINAAFAYFFNENINDRNNYFIESSLVNYLVSLPPQATVTFSKEFVVAEMWNLPAVRARSVPITTQPDYVITTNVNQIQEKPRSAFSQGIKFVTTKLGLSPSSHALQSPLVPPSGYALEREFEVFSVYKRLSENINNVTIEHYENR